MHRNSGPPLALHLSGKDNDHDEYTLERQVSLAAGSSSQIPNGSPFYDICQRHSNFNVDGPAQEGSIPFTVDGETYKTWYKICGDLTASPKSVPLVAIHGGKRHFLWPYL